MPSGSTVVEQFSIALPWSQDDRIFVHVTVQNKSALVFVSTAVQAGAGLGTATGSFIYAVPASTIGGARAPPLATVLYCHEPTVEFSTALAKLLARKMELPVLVGSSLNFQATMTGGSVEEQTDTLKSLSSHVLEIFSMSMSEESP